MLLPHNPYRLPQHYKRHVCGHSCGWKHRFLWISPNFEHWFCLNYMGTVHNWQPHWATTRVWFIGQCWYFNPQWTAGPPINKMSCVSNIITHWNKCVVAMCRHMNQGIWRGLGGRGGPFWLHRETLTFRVPAAYLNTAGISDKSEQKSSKIGHTVCDVCKSFGYLKGLLSDVLRSHTSLKG
jgi:hypothetical protein